MTVWWSCHDWATLPISICQEPENCSLSWFPARPCRSPNQTQSQARKKPTRQAPERQRLLQDIAFTQQISYLTWRILEVKKSHAVYRCFPHLIALLDLHWPQQTWATTDIGWLDDTGYFNQHFRFMNPQVLGIAQPLVTIGGSSKPMTMQPTSSYAPGITRTKFSWSIPPPCLAQTCWVLLVGFNSCLQQLDELDYTKCYAENCHFRRKWARTIGLSKELQRLPQLGSGSPSLDWTNRKEACLPSLARSPSLFYTIISLPQGSSAWTIHGKLGNWTH